MAGTLPTIPLSVRLRGRIALLWADFRIDAKHMDSTAGLVQEVLAIVPRFRGELVMYIGDGLLATFESASVANSAALAMQKIAQHRIDSGLSAELVIETELGGERLALFHARPTSDQRSTVPSSKTRHVTPDVEDDEASRSEMSRIFHEIGEVVSQSNALLPTAAEISEMFEAERDS